MNEVLEYYKRANTFFPYPLYLEKTFISRISGSNGSHSPSNSVNSSSYTVIEDVPERLSSVQQASIPSNMSQSDVDKELDQLKYSFERIVNVYILEGSIQIPLTERHIKRLEAERQRKNLHPDVFKPAFEHIGVMLQQHHLKKFIRQTMTKPGGAAPTLISGEAAGPIVKRKGHLERNLSLQ